MLDFVNRTTVALAGAGLAAAMTASAGATVLSEGDSFTTVFGQIPGPTPSAAPAGLLAADVGEFPDASVLNGLEAFTSFNVQNLAVDLLGGGANQGQIIFLQNGGFYVGGAGPAAANALTEQGQINLAEFDVDLEAEGTQVVNNRGYGVFGEGRSDILFDAGVVSSVDLQVRGTAEGLSVGPDSALGQSLIEGSPLGEADATLLIYTNLGLQVTTSVSNASFEEINLSLGAVIDGQTITGDSITRISLVNEGPENSAIVLGELTATVIPEPASLVLLASGGLMMLKRRKA